VDILKNREARAEKRDKYPVEYLVVTFCGV